MNFRHSCVALVLSLAAVTHADDVEDSINEALKLYKEGKLTESAASLQIAVNAINEKKGGSITSALPDKIGDWVGGESSNSNALAALGGGTTVERSYTKGEKKASFTIIADSPLISQITGIIANPAIAGLAGIKVKKVDGNMVTLQKDAHSAQMVVDNRFLVQVQGSDLKEEALLELLGGVKTEVLKDLK